jgi:uncharacterized protein (DUF302 family)
MVNLARVLCGLSSANQRNLEKEMSYYLSQRCRHSFESSLERVRNAPPAEGFGVLTESDVKATLKKKLDVDFRYYRNRLSNLMK